MAYLGVFQIDDYVGIPAATHRFSSGAAYAPTVLTYSIYEEATAVGIDEDVDMVVASPFDSITGCYWVRRQLTALAGFEEGKNYLVVVKATVDSVAAIQMHTFQIEAAGALEATAQSILADTAEIGVAGAGLTALGDTRLVNLDAAVSTRGTADPGDAMTLADDAITAAKFDESSAYPLKAADTGSTYIARTGADSDTLETLSDQLDTIDANVDSILVDTGTTLPASIAAVDSDVWAYATRTLTQSAASVTAAVSGSTITIHRGDSLSASLTGLGNISDRSKLWFTVKDDKGDPDIRSIIQIEESAGLQYLNAGDASARSANGSITVDDEISGDITIVLEKSETDDLSVQSNIYYDVQVLTEAGIVTTLTSGTCNVTADVTRRVA
jgi:hypothetical protein